MNNFIINNILESSTSTGVSNLTLAGAVSGYKSFLSVYKANQFIFYRIWHTGANEWEEGSGYVSGTTLYRQQVRTSSNSNNIVNFSAGSKRVTACLLIEQSQSSTSTDGWLSSTDWNTFNNKQGSLGYTPENTANKSSSYTLSSTTTYANTKALVDGLGTKQDTLVSGTNIKTINSSSILGSGDLSVSGYDPLTDQHFFEDYAFDTNQGANNFYAVGTQGGTGQGGTLLSSAAYSNAIGVFRLTSGTTALTGLALLSPGSVNPTYKTGVYALTYVTRINMSVLSDGTNTYTIRCGLITNAYNANPTNGIFFRYTHSVNSGNYECVCRNTNVETVINTSIAPAITTNWDKLEFRINAAGTSVEFFINGVSQGTTITNIPTALLVRSNNLHKQAGGSSQLMDIDMNYIKITRTI